MPALITHHLFGERAARTLPDDILSTQEDLLAFLLGNQGPDPFYARFSTTPEKASRAHRLAECAHGERMCDVFASVADGIGRLPACDTDIGRAFGLGMLAHYALDRSAHPLVLAEQAATIAANHDLDGADDAVHALIESDIDVWMLWRCRHTTVLENLPATWLCHTPRIARVAGALTSQVAHTVWGMDLGADEYAATLANMEFVYRAIEPAGSARSTALGTIERSFEDHSLLQALAHRVSRSDTCEFTNDDHRRWQDPFTGAWSRASFSDAMDQALDDWGALSRAFLAHDDLSDLVAHVNYLGMTIGPDEHWERLG